MNITLIHGEVYDRSTGRRVCMIFLLLVLILLSLWKTDRIGVLLLLVFIGLYAWYEWKMHKSQYIFDVSEGGITIGNKLFGRDIFEGFSIGFKHNEVVYQTLYLYTSDQDTLLFTLQGDQEEIKDVAELLATRIPLISPPRISSVRKLLRLLRI